MIERAIPDFMKRDKREPATPPLPRIRPEEQRQMAMDFFNGHDRTLEENAYLRSEVDHLRVELQVKQEQVRSLERELNFVRDDRDRLLQHDTSVMNSLENIEALIVSAKAKARAEAYAPPATGTGDGPERQMDAADEIGLQGIAKALAPEQGNG